MNQPARKSGDPASSKLAESLPVDDPSIPVLTERLTLPPLDLNLEFRSTERPAADEPNSVAPHAEVPGVPIEPLEPIEPLTPLEGVDPSEPLTAESQESEPYAEEAPLTTVIGDPTAAEPPESSDASPRVPTSLLVSNIDALLATPPEDSPYREADEFDLIQSDGSRASRMQTELREMILLELARRLPMEVEAIVRRHLEKAIDDAIRRFAVEVRIALAGSLREIVDRAVKQELDRLNVPHK